MACRLGLPRWREVVTSAEKFKAVSSAVVPTQYLVGTLRLWVIRLTHRDSESWLGVLDLNPNVKSKTKPDNVTHTDEAEFSYMGLTVS